MVAGRHRIGCRAPDPSVATCTAGGRGAGSNDEPCDASDHGPDGAGRSSATPRLTALAPGRGTAPSAPARSASSARRILPSAVRGIDATSTTGRGAQNARQLLLDRVAQRVERRRASPAAGTTNAVTTWPHSSSGVPATATSATPGRSRSTASTGSGHTFSPPVMIRSPRAAVDVQPAVVEPAAEVAGREPAVDERIGAVAVGPQQHRAAQVDLAVGVDAHLDAVERAAVVDDAAAGLGHPVRRDDVRPAGRPAARRRRGRSRGTRAGSIRAQRGRHERHVASRRTAVDGVGVEPGQHGERRARDQRPGDDGRARRRGPAAGRPASGRPGSTPSRALVATADARDGVVGQHDALRRAGRAARGDDEGVAGLDRAAVRRATCGAVGRRRRPPAPSPPAAPPWPRAGRRWSTGKAASPRVPLLAERVDERRAAREVEGDEPRGTSRREHGVDRRERADARPRGLGRGERGEVGEAGAGELGADRQAVGEAARRRRRPAGRAGWPAAPGASSPASPSAPSTEAMSAPWANAGCAHVGVSSTSHVGRRTACHSRCTPWRSAMQHRPRRPMSTTGVPLGRSRGTSGRRRPSRRRAAAHGARCRGISSSAHSSIGALVLGGTASATSWPASASASAARADRGGDAGVGRRRPAAR